MTGVGAERVRARAWCRADLAGGTLDIWPLGLLHEDSCTVNVALDLAVEIEVERRVSGYRVSQGGSIVEAGARDDLLRDDNTSLIGVVADHYCLPPVDVSVRSRSPRGGGLGGSSALAIAMIAASEVILGAEPTSPTERSALARDFEARLMALPTGRQDHFPALLGGALRVEHRAGRERIVRLTTDLEELGRVLVVAYTGQSHFSAGKNWQIIRSRLDGDPATIERFDGIAGVARDLSAALERGDLPEVGALVSLEWEWRRGLANGISTERIESMLEAAIDVGAWGGKACGAGGGGCIVLTVPVACRKAVETVLEELGAEVLPARPTARTLEVETL